MILALSGNPFYDYAPPLFGDRSSGACFGLGAAPTASALIGASAQGLSTGLTTKSTVAGTIAGGLAVAALYDPEPISKAILAISAAFVGPLISMVNRGCGQTCIVATQAANAAADASSQVKAQYWGAPAPRPKSLQQAALTALTNIANALKQACSDPSLGDAGKRCISERLVRGGANDFWAGLYDPIANDPDVVDDATATVSGVATSLGIPSSLAVPAAIAAALILVGVLL